MSELIAIIEQANETLEKLAHHSAIRQDAEATRSIEDVEFQLALITAGTGKLKAENIELRRQLATLEKQVSEHRRKPVTDLTGHPRDVAKTMQQVSAFYMRFAPQDKIRRAA